MDIAPGDASRSTSYLQHLGLREPPFGVTPDTAYLFPCRSIREALQRLVAALVAGEGLLKLTGDVGTGKTLVCRKLLAALDSKWRSIYVPSPAFDPRTLYLSLADGLGVAVDPDIDQHHLLKAITRGLLNLAREGRRALLCIDEGQAMPAETLEALRLITNLETQKRKLLQVVLVGQPELEERLASPALRQLQQRITFQHHMGTLDESELGAYVAHRMAIAGYSGAAVLGQSEAQRLYRLSAGVPRLVNVLMHKALLLAGAEGANAIERRHLEAAAADTPAVATLGETFMNAQEPAAAPASAVERMLAELERRDTFAGVGTDRRRSGRAAPAGGQEWFWRTVAGLLAIAIGWIGWVAYQLQPVEGLVTEQAYKAAEEARKRQSAGTIRSPVSPLPAAPPQAQAPQADEAAKETGYALRMEPVLFTAIPKRPATAQPAAD